jgi:hypothetical protein
MVPKHSDHMLLGWREYVYYEDWGILEDLDIDGMIVLKYILNKKGVDQRFSHEDKVYWFAWWPLAYQGLGSVKLVVN